MGLPMEMNVENGADMYGVVQMSGAANLKQNQHAKINSGHLPVCQRKITTIGK